MSSFLLPPRQDPVIVDVRVKITASKRFMIAWLGIVWFETIATLPKERRHLWDNSRWTPLKILFLMNRWISPLLQSLYAGLVVAHVSNATCGKVYWLQPFAVIGVMFLCASIMSIRVYALYNQSRTILISLVALVCLEQGAMVAAATQFYPLFIPKGFGDLVNLHGCVATGKEGRASRLVAIFWAAPLSFDTCILLLTVYNILVINRKAKHLPVLANILRGGLGAFTVISITNLVNVALYAQSDIVLQNFNNPTSVALTSILCSRLVISLYSVKTVPMSRTSSAQSKGWTPPFSTPATYTGTIERIPTNRKSDDFGDEEHVVEHSSSSTNGIELRQLQSTLPTDSPNGIQFLNPRLRPHRSTPPTLVSLERCGLIAPSATRSISRPMPFRPNEAPFSDVLPVVEPSQHPSSSTESSPKSQRSKSTTAAEGLGEKNGESGGGSPAGTPGFAIVVARETVVVDHS